LLALEGWVVHAAALAVASNRVLLSDLRTCDGVRLSGAGALAEIGLSILPERIWDKGHSFPGAMRWPPGFRRR
jgi:hypothetical protein